TFALVLVIADVVALVWGRENKTGPAAPGLEQSVRILGQLFPSYDLVLIAVGPAVALALWWVFYRTRWGVLIRAASLDRETVAVLALALIVRPWGLLGRPEAPGRSAGAAVGGERPLAVRRAAVPALLALLLVPPWLPSFWVLVLVEVLVFALFAASLHLLMGTGGMVSFGHAATFGLGAYGAALLVQAGRAPMLLAFLAAPLVAAVGAALIGFFCVRLSRIYFAMLTLAFCQIAY